ncbi:RNA polymerase sigma-70 factor, ECF subfamily [Siphonobacter aquaeclarae]|uniref:RNA polymerase sigma-70 factor, ECF subfamily n=2 Tax=Siphonobacter aquaeclarae TaxID=563176 RepID=A0A1G9HF28_9BACT|nr:RNA polymerase sigma-70 factor, ECF subfamily [Siphonobacter aquaeclarae]
MNDSTGSFPGNNRSRMADDKQIWDAYQQKGAFAELYNFYVRDLLRYGYRISSDRQLVQDHLQDLFVHLWNHRDRLGHVQEPRFYLYKSLRNRILRSIESNRLIPTVDGVLSEEWFPDGVDAEPTWVETEHRHRELTRLQAALERLPVRQQEVIQLRYYHDFSTEEIARIMKVNEQSARNLLFRAVRQLRGQLPSAILLLLFSQPV